jgi:hypothetical protein
MPRAGTTLVFIGDAQALRESELRAGPLRILLKNGLKRGFGCAGGSFVF